MLNIDDLALVVNGAERYLQSLDPDGWADGDRQMKAAIDHVTKFGVAAEEDLPVDKVTKRRGGWIQTHNKRRFFPFDPKAAEVDLKDIAFSLANTTRFCGHSPFYPVSIHSIQVMMIAVAIAKKRGLAEHEIFLVRAYALIHDANEAYGPDVSAPVKEFLPRVKELEALVQGSIHEHFLLPPPDPAIYEIVKMADKIALLLEGESLFPDTYHLWKVSEMPHAELTDDIRRAAYIPPEWQVVLEEIRERIRYFNDTFYDYLDGLLAELEEKAGQYKLPEEQESSGKSSWRDEVVVTPIVDDPFLPPGMDDKLREEYEDIFGKQDGQ